MSETNSLNSVEQTTDPTRPRDADTLPAPDVSGHPLFERIGVGGMGEVYRCGDDALGRDLAIKVLKAELRGDTDAEERFLREARLTGSLQHPGIVPVHHLRRLADGRPCYTMKLVRGRTLADLLRQEPDGPERLPRLLAIFEKVCQAVAFAHSRGVIHRDLKPANVMVGEFGEVQVMDWGLAKELSRAEPATPDAAMEDAETVGRVEEAAGLSRAGAALGTPAYMPPEQAAGDWDIVDERADVFALGAVLCEMLTGRPPYHGANREDLLRRARRGDLAEALGRLAKCGADAALVDLCRACLAAERLQRPRHAGVVAGRLASYQAEVRERLRQAELERARAEVQAREERKRRRLALALSALVLLVFVAGTVISTLFAVDAGRQADAAGKNAAEAAREKRKANDNAKRAEDNAKRFEEEKRSATQARDEAETALIDGLLRPIGRRQRSLGGMAVGPMNEGEAEAFALLHHSRNDRVRLRFIEEGLRTAERARRLDERAEWIIQAVVGLDAGRRRQLEEVLIRRLHDREAPPEVTEACVALGIALEVHNPFFDERVAETIVAATDRSINRNDFGRLPMRLRASSPWLNAAAAGKVSEALLAALAKNTHPIFFLPSLSESLRAVSGRLDAAAAGKAADRLVAVIGKTKYPDDAHSLWPVLQEVSKRLDVAAAGKAADALIAEMGKTDDPNKLSGLSQGLMAVSWRLDDAAVAHAGKAEDVLAAGKAAEALVAAMSKTNDPTKLTGLSWGLRAVSRRLDADAAGKVADALLAAVEKNTDPKALDRLSQALQAVSGRLNADAAGKAADALVTRMSKTTDPAVLSSLSQTLQELSGRLDAVRAAAYAGKAAEALVTAMSKITDPFVRSRLSQTLQEVSGRLDAAAAGKAADALVTAMGKANHPNELSSLSLALQEVSERLDAAAAADYAGKAVGLLLAAMSKTNQPPALSLLSQALCEVSERLDAATAGRFAEVLGTAMGKTTDPVVLYHLSRALQAVSERLEGAEAYTRKAADELVAMIGKTDDLNVLYWLPQALQAVSGRLEDAQAYTGKAAEALAAAIRKTNDPPALLHLSVALQAVGWRLDTATADKIADALITTMNKNPNSPGLSFFLPGSGRVAGTQFEGLRLFQGLQACSEQRPTAELVALLGHPLVAGEAQRVLLDVLGRRTRRHFRNTWHFLDWAQSNGVAFVPASPSALPAR